MLSHFKLLLHSKLKDIDVMVPLSWRTAVAQLTAADFVLAMLLLFASSAAVHRLTSKGPMLWPVLGIIPTALYHLGDVYEWVTAAAARSGGTFPFRGMWCVDNGGVITVDPVNVEYVLKTHFANFPKGRYFRERFEELLGDGIFNADDREWREQRVAASAEMHSARFAEHSARIVADLVHRKLLRVLAKVSAAGDSVDLQDVLLRFTFDNICAVAFGVDPGCLTADLPVVPFAKAFEQATELSLFRFILPPAAWKAMRWLDVGPERRLKEAVQIVHEFAENTLAERRKEMESCRGSAFERSDLLSRLIEAELAGEQGGGGHGARVSKFSNKFLEDFCISFILAGRDTSSVALAWFFWLLWKHPRVEESILREIADIIKTSGKVRAEDADVDGVVFTVEELQRMEYLQAAISESLRLYPSVPVDFKQAAADDVFPDGTPVRKGARVLYSIYSMARMESIWGAECREFKPERWLKGGAFVAESQFKYTVFNGGPRLCVGKKFAYLQMKMVAAATLLRYRVEVADGHVVAPKLTTTLYMKNGLRVTFKKRNH